MTTIERKVKRETAARYRGRALVVELQAGQLALYPKGTRRRFVLDYEVAYEVAMKIEARARQIEKDRARKAAAKRKGKGKKR
jgi:hypothetical protein